MAFVVSTLTDSVKYTIYDKSNPDLPRPKGYVLVKGGANVANEDGVGVKSEGVPIWTPRGVATEVTADQVALLKEHELFRLHEANGFVQILEKLDSADDAAVDMKAADKAAPLTDAKLKDEGLPTASKAKA